MGPGARERSLATSRKDRDSRITSDNVVGTWRMSMGEFHVNTSAIVAGVSLLTCLAFLSHPSLTAGKPAREPPDQRGLKCHASPPDYRSRQARVRGQRHQEVRPGTTSAPTGLGAGGDRYEVRGRKEKSNSLWKKPSALMMTIKRKLYRSESCRPEQRRETSLRIPPASRRRSPSCQIPPRSWITIIRWRESPSP